MTIFADRCHQRDVGRASSSQIGLVEEAAAWTLVPPPSAAWVELPHDHTPSQCAPRAKHLVADVQFAGY
jgi:hypothetical protein